MTDEKTIAAYNTQVERYATMVDGLTVDPTLLVLLIVLRRVTIFLI